jgi:ABC-type branched-subunit amino acid transport system permease subunit
VPTLSPTAPTTRAKLNPMSYLWIIGVLLLAVVPIIAPNQQLLINLALAKGLGVVGVTVLLRAGQVSFGHALFFGASAYIGAFIMTAAPSMDFFVLLVAGTVGAVLSGLLVGLFVVRYRGIFFGMLNLAFSMIVWSVLEKFYHVTGGADGIRLARPTVLGMELDRADFEIFLYYLAIVLMVGFGWFTIRWFASPVGQLFQTIKTNETRLEYLGISPRRALLSGYLLSAALCGFGGIMMGTAQGVVTPEYIWWVRSAEMVFIAVLGGAGSVRGAFLGALIYEFVRTYAAAYAGDVWQMLLGGFLLIIILFAPGGLIGIFGSLFNRGQTEDRT